MARNGGNDCVTIFKRRLTAFSVPLPESPKKRRPKAPNAKKDAKKEPETEGEATPGPKKRGKKPQAETPPPPRIDPLKLVATEIDILKKMAESAVFKDDNGKGTFPEDIKEVLFSLARKVYKALPGEEFDAEVIETLNQLLPFNKTTIKNFINRNVLEAHIEDLKNTNLKNLYDVLQTRINSIIASMPPAKPDEAQKFPWRQAGAGDRKNFWDILVLEDQIEKLQDVWKYVYPRRLTFVPAP